MLLYIFIQIFLNQQNQCPAGDSITVPQRKELKLEEASMDPLQKLHEDVHSLIVQHFTGSDLLQISEVSPDWHEKVITDGAMRKIKLCLSLDDSENFREIMKSERNFKNIETETKSYLNIVTKHAATLEELKICGDLPLEENDFPNLRKLTMMNVPSNILWWISISRFNSLRDLTCNFESTNVAVCFFFFTFLLNLPKLETLNLCSEVNLKALNNVLVIHELRAPAFKLRKLVCFYAPAPEFWNSQAESLESIDIKVSHENAITFLLGNFPKLKELRVTAKDDFGVAEDTDEDSDEDEDELEYPTNHNIEVLHSSLPFPVTKKIMLATPLVEHIKFEELTTELLDWIVANMKKVKKIEFRSRSEEHENQIRQHYEDLKQQDDDINKKIELSILKV